MFRQADGERSGNDALISYGDGNPEIILFVSLSFHPLARCRCRWASQAADRDLDTIQQSVERSKIGPWVILNNYMSNKAMAIDTSLSTSHTCPQVPKSSVLHAVAHTHTLLPLTKENGQKTQCCRCHSIKKLTLPTSFQPVTPVCRVEACRESWPRPLRCCAFHVAFCKGEKDTLSNQ